jgi:hypothetical protein
MTIQDERIEAFIKFYERFCGCHFTERPQYQGTRHFVYLDDKEL